MTYYLVRASSGEYSDRTEWPVALYADEPSAKAHVERASCYANRLEALYDDWQQCDEYDPFDPTRSRVIAAVRNNPFDPPTLNEHPCGIEYAVYEALRNPPRYWYEVVQVRSAVPELAEAQP